MLSPQLLAWLEERGIGYVIGAIWIWTLLRDRTDSRKRSEQLSDALCRAIESGSAERARMADEYRLGHDWTVRSLLDHFRELTGTRPSGGASMLRNAPLPPKPPKRAESEKPPPLPSPAAPPKRKT
jgi:hypothetical protein